MPIPTVETLVSIQYNLNFSLIVILFSIWHSILNKVKSQQIKKIIAKIPDAPGVYFFRDKAGKILYIGKATSLRDRVKSYMSKTVFDTRSPLVGKMLEGFDDIKYIKTDSVLEALVLEANLIKKYQPEANIKEKDNRSFNFVVITKEDFPRVLIVRGRELMNSKVRPLQSSSPSSPRSDLGKLGKSKVHDVLYTFGPFPNGSQLKEALKIIRKMFPFRDKCKPAEALLPQKFSEPKNPKVRPLQSNSSRSDLGRPCFNRQIGLCPGVCTGEITREDYKKQIQNIILFFEGNKKRLLKNLEKQMQSFARNRQFEKANIIKHTIFTLNHIQDVSLIKQDFEQRESLIKGFRVESYDIAHMSGTNVVGVMTVVEDGEVKKSDYRKFKIRWFDKFTTGNNSRVNDTKALTEILSRRLSHIDWQLPDLIVVDGGLTQKRVIEKTLQENHQRIPVVSVVKDERHKPREILGDRSIALTAGKKWQELEREILLSNSEAHRFAISFHKKLREKI